MIFLQRIDQQPIPDPGKGRDSLRLIAAQRALLAGARAAIRFDDVFSFCVRSFLLDSPLRAICSLSVEDQFGTVDFDEGARFELLLDSFQIRPKKAPEFLIADISGRDQEQARWFSFQEMACHKVTVFRDKNPSLLIG